MGLRGALRLAVLVVIALMLAIPYPRISASSGGSPAWSLDQAWTYAGFVAGYAPREDFIATVRVIELGPEVARVRAVIVYGFGTVVEDTLVALPSFTVVAMNASFPNGVSWTFHYDPALRLFSFPLIEGKTWRSESTFSYSYRVMPRVELATPAGSFAAVPVEQDAMGIPFITLQLIVPGLGKAVLYYSSDIGHLVRYEAFENSGAKVAEFSLISSIPDRRPDAGSPPWLWMAVASFAAAVTTAATIRGAHRGEHRRAAARAGPTPNLERRADVNETTP